MPVDRRAGLHSQYDAYEAAAEKYLGTVEADDAEVCKGNMAKIMHKQRNPDMVIGFNRHGLDIDQTLFYPPVQVPASKLSSSGS